MKKKVLFVGLFLIATIAVSFQFSAKRNNLESLMLENIDALASGEWGTLPQCVGSGSVDCPATHVKVYRVMSGYSLEDLN
ncbi:MAG: NVEALA domain-containing protein [Bacteroides sp.]|nr:NVEALA domain-containing protein [Bacteroides sp.]